MRAFATVRALRFHGDAMIDFAVQRKNMVEAQVRPSDITDRRIIRAMLSTPRDAFCPDSVKATAYRDEQLRVSDPSAPMPRAMPAPRVLAKMLQALELGDRDSVLEIGMATGYGSAILSQIAAKVTAVEYDQQLGALARKALDAAGVTNVVIIHGEHAGGHAATAPYDAILIGGSVPDVPRALLDQLKDGGRLVAVVKRDGMGRLMQWRRLGGGFDSRVICEVGAPRVPGFEQPAAFVF